MIRLLTPRRGFLCLCLAALAWQVGCTDLPTGKDSFQLEADGQTWVAVMIPENLPDASTWLRYAAPDPLVPSLVAEEVAALQRRAVQARAVGDVGTAQVLRMEAARRAVAAMGGTPPTDVLLRARASLDAWTRSVRTGVDLSRMPSLAKTVDAVGRDSEAVDAALLAGDAQSAALRLTEAAERIRDWSPEGVALQVLDRAEDRLNSAAPSGIEQERALRLLYSARQELMGGNPMRAMQRALYALQLAGGSELHEIPLEDLQRCGEYSC